MRHYAQRGHMRRNMKVDANQKEIVAELNKIHGVTAVSIGFPLDILVGVAWFWYEDCQPRTWLIDIKNPEGKDRKTDRQTEFDSVWLGQKDYCRTFDEVLKVIGLKG